MEKCLKQELRCAEEQVGKLRKELEQVRKHTTKEGNGEFVGLWSYCSL